MSKMAGNQIFAICDYYYVWFDKIEIAIRGDSTSVVDLDNLLR